jgi:hypothetical protein
MDTTDLEIRLDIWAQALAGIFEGVFVSKKLTPETADKALRISLAIWGLDEAQAEKLTSSPIAL